MKASYQTGEFWMSIVTGVIGVLVMAGKISQAEADQLTKAVTAAAGAVVTIASLLGYVITRIQLKQSVVDAITETSTTAHPATNGDPLAQPKVEAMGAQAKTYTAADAFHAALTQAGV